VKPSEIAESLRSGAERVHEELSKEVPRSTMATQATPGTGRLSETGKAILEDISKVAEDTQKIVEEKLQPASAAAEQKGIDKKYIIYSIFPTLNFSSP